MRTSVRRSCPPVFHAYPRSAAAGCLLGPLAAADKIHNFDPITGTDFHTVPIRLGYHRLIDFNRNPSALEFQPFDQGREACVTVHGVRLAVELNREYG